MAFCAKDHNRDFAWNVEQNYALPEIKHMAGILLQFLKSSGTLYYIFLVFVLLSLALMRRNARRMALGGWHEVSFGIFL